MTEKIKTLYFDESGHTGYDLLNGDQPIFSVVSTDIENQQAEIILKTAFPTYQAAEFKFTNIWSRSTHKRRLLAFADTIGEFESRVFLHANVKRFVLLTKMVDTLVEPVAHAAGFNFYENGWNRGYVNMLHFALNEFSEPQFYDALLVAYDRFTRSPDQSSLSVLHRQLVIMANSCPEEIHDFVSSLAMGAQAYNAYNNIDLQRGSNDLQLTTVLASVHYWSSKYVEEFKIIHDASSQFFRQQEMWDTITSIDVPDGAIFQGEDREAAFPLRVVETISANSVGNYSLQLCDVLAGLFNKLLRSDGRGASEELKEEMLQSGLQNIVMDGMRPETNFIDGPPSLLNGPDAIDQFTSLVFGNRGS